MRKTAREEYTERLEDALEELRGIRRRFEQQGGGDLLLARQILNTWKAAQAGLIETYGTREDAKLFLQSADFDAVGLTGSVISNGISTYDALLKGVLAKLPELDVRGGYAEDIRASLEQIDDLRDRLVDSFRRSMRGKDLDLQTAEEGLRRWRDYAVKVLTSLAGDEEAGHIYTMTPPEASWEDQDGSLEEQYEMFLKYLRNLKEEIQKYPDHLIVPAITRRAIGNPTDFVDASRLHDLKQINSSSFDLSRLIALCEELNITWREGAHHGTAMLVRAVLDHVPPIFGVSSFVQVASNYGGAKSFKEAMFGLESAARKIADAHLHTKVRKSESLPTSTQVNFSPQMDVLLAEVVRILK
ncbi:MAG: hypothetical protein QOF63_2424 [Thermoanaerobaculia bacterium]|jgi:hypothetical protein|nr:hypothetical protein [Thermoanaerobaculia bacterium]